MKAVFERDSWRKSAYDEISSPVNILAVGELEEWRKRGNLPPVSDMVFVAFQDLDGGTLDALRPSVVYSPLLARSFDCIDLAQLLNKLGYSGEYRAVAEEIPNPKLIEREVRELCPGIRFQIVSPP